MQTCEKCWNQQKEEHEKFNEEFWAHIAHKIVDGDMFLFYEKKYIKYSDYVDYYNHWKTTFDEEGTLEEYRLKYNK